MRVFIVRIGQRGKPRLVFEVTAEDACTAISQHFCLALPGERVDVEPKEPQ